MAKAPDPRRIAAERRREVAQAQQVIICCNDERYPLRPSELTPALVGELRQRTGYTFLRLMMELHQAPDIDVAAIAVWFARRAQGETVTLAEVQRSISWDDLVWASDVATVSDDAAEDADDPPVSGGN